MTHRDWLLIAAAAGLVVTASLSLDPVIDGTSWRGVVLPAMMVALTVAVAGRLLGAGAVTTALGSAVVWVLVTTVTHLESTGILPRTEQARQFVSLWAQGMADLVRDPAPVEAQAGLFLILATAAYWLAHGVHEILTRMRRPGFAIPLAGLLWGIPLAVPQPAGRTWPQVVPYLAAAAFTLLVVADADLRAPRTRPQGPHIAGSGVTLGALAIVVAASMPSLLPGYGEEPWVDLRPAPAARGYQPIVDITQRLKLPAPRDLLVVQADRPVYLRLAGLDTFDGGTWKLGPGDDRTFTPRDVVPAGRQLPFETEIRERELLTVTVESLGLENVFVPAPYHPLRVEGPAANRMVFSPEGSFIATSERTEGGIALLPGLSYTVEVARPNPSSDALRSIPADAFAHPDYAQWTALPQDYPELRQLARAIAEQAGATTPVDVALALQAYFRDTDRFRYSTDVPALRSSDALTRFITEDRVGYCEYFATAMAVMLRLEGIPARVAVGFTAGEETAPGEWLVTTDNAHAWVEALFPEYGWISFEPTPALPNALVPTTDNLAPTALVGRGLPDTPGDPTQPGEEPAPIDPPFDPDPGLDAPDLGPGLGGTDAGLGRIPTVLIVVLVVLSVALAVLGAATLASARRGRPRPDLGNVERTLAAQRRLYLEAVGHGVARRPSETAREVAERWSAEGRVRAEAARRLAELSQTAAFGGGLLDEGAGPEAERLADTLASDIRGSVDTTTRVLAPLRTSVVHLTASGRRRAESLADRLRPRR